MTMKITFEGALPDIIEQCKEWLSVVEPSPMPEPEPEKVTEAPAKRKKTVKKPEPSESSDALFDKLREVVREQVTVHGKDACREVLLSFGATQASKVPEGQRAEAIEALEALNNDA